MAMMIENALGRLMAVMIRRPACRRFIASQRGVAAIEFAMIMPVLLILFLSSFQSIRDRQHRPDLDGDHVGHNIGDQRSDGAFSQLSGDRHHFANKSDLRYRGDGELELHGQRHGAHGFVHRPAEQHGQEFMQQHISLLFHLVLGAIPVHSLVRPLHDRVAHPFRHSSDDAARQPMRPIQ
jgi:hypothetical protein